MAEFESLSPAAQRAMQFARAAAERMNHDRIGTENLLLGIVEERQDLAVYLLNLLDVRLKPLVELILATVEQDGPYAGELAFTDHAKAAFDNAELARKQLGHAQVGTVHLLFGVLDVETCRAVSILKRMQVDVDELRAALHSLYLPDGNRPPMGPILEKIRDVRLEHGDLEHAPIHVEMSEDDLTGRAKLIVGLARNCARSLNHESVGTDHLLVGLITDRYSAAADVLTRMGLTEKRAILAVRFARGLASSDRPPSKKGMSLSPRAQNALARARFAVRQAQTGREEPQRLAGRQQKQLLIGSGDLLVGLLEEHRGAANAILSSFELDEDEIRNKLRAHGVWRSLVARPRANEPATLWEWTNQQLNRRLWSLGDLQHHSGIARSSVRRWIRGDQRPSGDSCDALAAALGGHPNTVRRLAGRAPIHAGEVRPGSLGAIHALVDRVAWSDERIARITSLLNTMIGNEGDQRPIKGHDLPPPEVT